MAQVSLAHLDAPGSVCDEIIRGDNICSNCSADLPENFLEGMPSVDFEAQGRVAYDGDMLCEQCYSKLNDVPFNHVALSSLEPIEGSDSRPVSASEDSGDVNVLSSIGYRPTKLRALVADLVKHAPTEKSVVFSYWTHTLDIVQSMLEDPETKLAYTRIDGKTPLTKRSEALRAFQQHDNICVILVSITCGGAGLDLTAASRAYLLEPHWNPMVEEQALCRIHRVGQQRSVTTVRYLMRDSFEEQIVDLQKRKRLLAQVTFEQAPLSEEGIGMGTLQYLKKVLG